MTKRKTAFVVALVVIGVAALGLAAAVYAKYIASLQVTGSAQIAKWNFEEENESVSLTCNLNTGEIIANTVATDRIAPGTSGTCTFALTNTTSEVAVDYTLAANTTDSVNIPTNLELSADGTTWGTLSNFTDNGTITIGGTETVTIYWRWPYETSPVADGDAADTANGEAAVTTAGMTLAFDVSGVQHNPANAL